MSKKIIITGGHHNSALVVAKDLIKRGVEVEWIGHRHATRHDTNDSAEYIEVKATGIKFHNLEAGKWGAGAKLASLWEIPMGVLRARKILQATRPDAVLSFGSYLGASTALSALTQSIPVYLHEQTVVGGKANIFAANFARRVFLTWESSFSSFPREKSLLVGLPLRDSILSPKKLKLFNNSHPTILILGGKQGASSINHKIFPHLQELLQDYNLIHQTGTSSVTGDYEKATSLASSLPPNLAGKYIVRGYIKENEIGNILNSVDLYVGRSGAHTTYELGILGKNSILIPFVYTHKKEQLQNARTLEKAGLASILPQSDLSYPNLVKMIKQRLSHKTLSPLDLPRDASSKILDSVLKEI